MDISRRAEMELVVEVDMEKDMSWAAAAPFRELGEGRLENNVAGADCKHREGWLGWRGSNSVEDLSWGERKSRVMPELADGWLHKPL